MLRMIGNTVVRRAVTGTFRGASGSAVVECKVPGCTTGRCKALDAMTESVELASKADVASIVAATSASTFLASELASVVLSVDSLYLESLFLASGVATVVSYFATTRYLTKTVKSLEKFSKDLYDCENKQLLNENYRQIAFVREQKK